MSGELEPWWERAQCWGADPAIFTPASQGRHAWTEARALCGGCPVRLDCLNEALELGTETETYNATQDGWTEGFSFGMFQAGLTPTELTALKRQAVRNRG